MKRPMGSWPPEIDIFEFFGANNKFSVTVHGKNSTKWNKNIDINCNTATTQWHTYAVYRRPDQQVDVYFDGENKGTLPKPEPYKEMTMLINFGIGGQDWLGDPAPNTFPVYYDCDWVWVWQIK